MVTKIIKGIWFFSQLALIFVHYITETVSKTIIAKLLLPIGINKLNCTTVQKSLSSKKWTDATTLPSAVLFTYRHWQSPSAADCSHPNQLLKYKLNQRNIPLQNNSKLKRKRIYIREENDINKIIPNHPLFSLVK